MDEKILGYKSQDQERSSTYLKNRKHMGKISKVNHLNHGIVGTPLPKEGITYKIELTRSSKP